MSISDTADHAQDKRHLAEFLVGNRELEELSAKLNEFNILRVLRIEQAEIRHSNVLGWLLDPRESHGLGDTFVRRFISTLLLDNEQADFGLSASAVELIDLIDVEVRREWRNIDLLIHSRANLFVILIENKIRGRESRGQLLRYMDAVRRGFPDAGIVIPVLLTVEGDEPSEEAQGLGYVSWSHAELYGMATEVVKQHRNRIPQDAQTFLRHYLDTLRKETMQDRELEELCKSIYRKHRAAIDLIVKYGAATAFGEAADDFIREHAELEQVGRYSTEVWFIPREWARVMPDGVERWRSTYPVSLWCKVYPRAEKAGIVLEIGPLPDTERRRNLLEAFRWAGFTVPPRALREEAKYSRIYSETHPVSDLGDSNEVKKALEKLWRQSRAEVEKANSVIMNFDW
ncbi:MAG: PD-(D/E)XK nuclease family protein [Pyrinomonadaceae bacterium]